MDIDRIKFFNGYHDAFGATTNAQDEALEFLLGAIESDENISDPSWAAYMLATTKHETDDTFRPIEECGRGKGKKYGTPGKNGKVYYGRGFVQLTWEANYKLMGRHVGADLVSHPEIALGPSVAYCIMSFGMRHGCFTGKKLSDYLSGDERDYQNARRIINGVDCAEKIARYAVKFEKILEAARVE